MIAENKAHICGKAHWTAEPCGGIRWLQNTKGEVYVSIDDLIGEFFIHKNFYPQSTIGQIIGDNMFNYFKQLKTNFTGDGIDGIQGD